MVSCCYCCRTSVSTAIARTNIVRTEDCTSLNASRREHVLTARPYARVLKNRHSMSKRVRLVSTRALLVANNACRTEVCGIINVNVENVQIQLKKVQVKNEHAIGVVTVTLSVMIVENCTDIA